MSNLIELPFQKVKELQTIMEKIMNGSNKSCGFDALNMKYVQNMFEEGVIDPLKVVKAGLKNAVSASSTLLTTDVSISIFNESEET